MFLPLADCEKLHVWKNRQSLFYTWLMSHGGSISRGEVMQGKPGVASMACAVGCCSGENPVWLTYEAGSNIAFHLKTDTGHRLVVTHGLDL